MTFVGTSGRGGSGTACAHAAGGRGGGEGGFATLALVTILIPLMFLVGSYLQTMSGRQGRLQMEIREEQAMLTSEAGIDLALNEARRGSLMAGHLAEYDFAEELPGKSQFKVTCTYLGDDDLDNDNDFAVDESDEDVFRITTTGFAGQSARRVAAYLGFTSYIPTLTGAVMSTNPAMGITMSGTGFLHGENHDMTGTPTGSGDINGMAIASPGTIADLSAQLTAAEEPQIQGLGGTPSLGTTPAVNIQEIVDYARNGASVVITNANVNSTTFGSAAAPVLVFREGNVRFGGNTTGWGLLVVNGNVDLGGTFTWYGVIIVTGSVDAAVGTIKIYGGLMMGPSSPELKVTGTADIYYSSTGVAMAGSLAGRYVAFNGWQEISTN